MFGMALLVSYGLRQGSRKWLVYSQPVGIVCISTLAALSLSSGAIRVGEARLDWFADYRFVRTRDEALEELKRKEYNFRKVSTVVFLCGAANSNARDRLSEYIVRHRPGFNVFYAETAWNTIVQHNGEANALDVEERLGELADIVAIVVESPGTFAELGAFAMSPSLRRKLLLLLDRRYQGLNSFVATGPVKWVDRESTFSPGIWIDKERILDSAGDIDKRLDLIPASNRRISNLLSSPKHLLFFVADLVTVFGPVSAKQVTVLLKLLNFHVEEDASFYLGLGTALGLLSSFRFSDSEVFFRPLDADRSLRTFQKTRSYISIPMLRARVVAAMQRCDTGRKALAHMGRSIGTA